MERSSNNGSPTLSNNSGSQKTNNQTISHNDSENTTQPLNVTNSSNNSIYNSISSASQLTGTLTSNAPTAATNHNNSINAIINNNIEIDELPKEKRSRSRSKDRDRDRNMFTLPTQKDSIFGTLKRHAKRFSSQSFSEGKCDPNKLLKNRPKRDKYNRAYYSMNETIEVLADQVVEDESMVSLLIQFIIFACVYFVFFFIFTTSKI